MLKALIIAVILISAMPKAFASELVSMTELAILDENGTLATNFNPGDKLLIQASLQNNN